MTGVAAGRIGTVAAQDAIVAAERSPSGAPRLWVESVQLTNFRNYPSVSLRVGPAPVVLWGANGAGKTNLL
ncbi:MAG TPA: hypothetical protein VHI72_12445, partial [Hyphomicrobiaceae bacterium]|nr:hypothetical protein [Hyphomicrobiaceae bacterium]